MSEVKLTGMERLYEKVDVLDCDPEGPPINKCRRCGKKDTVSTCTEGAFTNFPQCWECGLYYSPFTRVKAEQ